MTPLFKKLNYKNQATILVLNAPASFETALDELPDTSCLRAIEGLTSIDFILAFVTKQTEIDEIIAALAPLLSDDATLWFCYPKGSSKRYTCHFNRDTGWASVGAFQLEPVRMVAIDEDWSALRFRKVDKIKKITRREDFALTTQAKQRTSNKNNKTNS